VVASEAQAESPCAGRLAMAASHWAMAALRSPSRPGAAMHFDIEFDQAWVTPFTSTVHRHHVAHRVNLAGISYHAVGRPARNAGSTLAR
jgi:hypothetical protein